jgi:hypothetical protein
VPFCHATSTSVISLSITYRTENYNPKNTRHDLPKAASIDTQTVYKNIRKKSILNRSVGHNAT